MSNKKLKKHRKLHGVQIPCPWCKEFRPGLKSFLVVKSCNYTTFYNDLMWDGSVPYLYRDETKDLKTKKWYEISCSAQNCTLKTSFSDEEDLKKLIIPYIETLLEDLIDVPAPAHNPVIPIVKGKKKKWTLKLVKRKDRETVEDTDAVPA